MIFAAVVLVGLVGYEAVRRRWGREWALVVFGVTSLVYNTLLLFDNFWFATVMLMAVVFTWLLNIGIAEYDRRQGSE